MTYTFTKIKISDEEMLIKMINEDGKEWFIPADSANLDYQEYLKSLDETDSL